MLLELIKNGHINDCSDSSLTLTMKDLKLLKTAIKLNSSEIKS